MEDSMSNDVPSYRTPVQCFLQNVSDTAKQIYANTPDSIQYLHNDHARHNQICAEVSERLQKQGLKGEELSRVYAKEVDRLSPTITVKPEPWPLQLISDAALPLWWHILIQVPQYEDVTNYIKKNADAVAFPSGGLEYCARLTKDRRINRSDRGMVEQIVNALMLLVQREMNAAVEKQHQGEPENKDEILHLSISEIANFCNKNIWNVRRSLQGKNKRLKNILHSYAQRKNKDGKYPIPKSVLEEFKKMP
jgi:hypothetical protein